MKDWSEAQIISASQKGDEASFGLLVERYLKLLYNFIYRIVYDKDTAEDITQETFIKIWKNIRRFDKKKNFKNWAYLIARRTAIDYLRKKKNLPFSFFEDEDGHNALSDRPDAGPTPDELVFKDEESEKVIEMMKTLPENYRTILNLYYKDGLELKEVAEIMELPYNTVKSQHRRAILRLRRIIKESAPQKAV